MNFKNVIKKINEAFLLSGYGRAAQQLLMLSDRQLDDLGISRALLQRGASGYPWRIEVQAIPDNVYTIGATKPENETTIMPKTPKAA